MLLAKNPTQRLSYLRVSACRNLIHLQRSCSLSTMPQDGELAQPLNGHKKASASRNLPKKLIIACDGTWQDRDNRQDVPTNISRLARAVSNEDKDNNQQIVYYQAGVGTGYGYINSILGGGFGVGIAENIREAYSFLAYNYSAPKDGHKPDSIFLIGYSRGAFTARSIGGLLGAVGLLKKSAMPFFFDIFEDWQNAGRRKPKFFERFFDDEVERKKYEPAEELATKKSPKDIDVYMTAYRASLLKCGLTQEVKIKCIGVFDTVGSLGVPVPPFARRVVPFLPNYLRPYYWFDTRIGDHVDHGFHALALDEKRSPFRPTLWELEEQDKSYIKQVWFPGSHGNVGGGHADSGIADVTLTWMMDHLSGKQGSLDREFKSEDWIQFDHEYIESYFEKCHNHYLRRLKEDNVEEPKGQPKGWALGSVFNSFTFPFTLAGERVRTPGRYLFTRHDTGTEIKGQLLKNTNEYIHPSVRERIHKGGLAPESQWRRFPLNLFKHVKKAYYAITGRITGGRPWPLYEPTRAGQPLHEWELHDGHPDHNRLYTDAEIEAAKGADVYWKYVGTTPGPQKISEDKIGMTQRKLVEMASHPDSVAVDSQSWIDSLTLRARRSYRRPSTF